MSQRVLRAATVIAVGAWCLIVSSVEVPAAAAGRVTGRVRVVARASRRLATPGAYPDRNVNIARPASAAEAENVVVFVKVPPRPTVPVAGAAMRQEGEEFLPHLLAVTTGTSVEFPNADAVFHNVFSLSGAATFDLGRYPLGTSRSRTFTKPGLAKVYCHLHSQMAGLIRVFDHPYFTIPDRTGRFAIPELPPAGYDVVAWHERIGEVTHHITVTEGQATDVFFDLPLAGEQ